MEEGKVVESVAGRKRAEAHIEECGCRRLAAFVHVDGRAQTVL